jgi:hypothetical protein
MTFEKIKSLIKNLYTTNSETELKNLYKKMSSLELVNLLSSEGLRPEASDLARNMLIERLNLNPDFTLSEVFDIELNRLTALSKMCHICGERNPSQKHKFLMCKKAGIKVNWSHLISGAALNLVTVPVFGVNVIPFGNTSQKYQAIRLDVCLCDYCAGKTKHITKDMCKNHPLAEFYMLSGFNDIMWPSELESC